MNTKEEKWLLEEKYQGEKSEAFFTDLEKLKNGEPLGYIIGNVPFLNCDIYLDSKPLIPRSETEYWVEEVIKEIEKEAAASPRPLQILDLCAGSGVIGIAVAKAIPNSHVHFAEVDKSHLPTIGKNLGKNNIACTRYKVFESDLFENIKDNTYDFILSNPPYINPTSDRSDLSVRDYEPHLALYGGNNGLEIIEKIIKQAPDNLSENGVLYIEHEPEQSIAIAELAKENGFESQTYTDQYQIERYTRLQKI